LCSRKSLVLASDVSVKHNTTAANLFQDLDEDDLETSFEQYCQDIQDTAAWGGQTELNALAHVLQHHIKVYAAGLPVVVMGQQYQGNHT